MRIPMMLVAAVAAALVTAPAAADGPTPQPLWWQTTTAPKLVRPVVKRELDIALLPRTYAGIVALGHHLQQEGCQPTEHPAFGGVDLAAHVPGSLHKPGLALDVVGCDLGKLSAELVAAGWHLEPGLENASWIHVDTGHGDCSLVSCL